MKKEKKINELPLAPPEITTPLLTAYRLAITSLRDDIAPWIYSTYVNFSCNGNDFGITYTDIPFIGDSTRTYSTKKYEIDYYIKKIIEKIDKGVYVTVQWDEYFVPCRFSYQRRHFDHYALFYGYDLENEEFLVYGYNEKSVLKPEKVSFKDFENSFTYQDKSCWHMIRQRKFIKRGFRFKRFKRRLQYYYESRLPKFYKIKDTHSLCKGKTFGLVTYDSLKNYLMHLPEIKDKRQVWGSVISITTFYEHKKLIRKALEYLQIKDCIDGINVCEAFKELEKMLLTIKNMLLKYYKTDDEKIINLIIPKVDEVKEFEKKALEKLLIVLKNVDKKNLRKI